MSTKANSMQSLYHRVNHYRVNFVFMTKKDAYNLIKNAVIIDTKGTL